MSLNLIDTQQIGRCGWHRAPRAAGFFARSATRPDPRCGMQAGFRRVGRPAIHSSPIAELRPAMTSSARFRPHPQGAGDRPPLSHNRGDRKPCLDHSAARGAQHSGRRGHGRLGPLPLGLGDLSTAPPRAARDPRIPQGQRRRGERARRDRPGRVGGPAAADCADRRRARWLGDVGSLIGGRRPRAPRGRSCGRS